MLVLSSAGSRHVSMTYVAHRRDKDRTHQTRQEFEERSKMPRPRKSTPRGRRSTRTPPSCSLGKRRRSVDLSLRVLREHEVVRFHSRVTRVTARLISVPPHLAHETRG